MEGAATHLSRLLMVVMTGLLVVYVGYLHAAVASGPASGPPSRSAYAPPAPRSGAGSPVLLFDVRMSPAGPGSEASARVAEDGGGSALRGAIESGAVRYCAMAGPAGERRVYLASAPGASGPAAGAEPAWFEIKLGAPSADDPPVFPAGAAAPPGETYKAPGPAPGAPSGFSAGLLCF